MAKSLLQRLQKVVVDVYDPERDERVKRIAAKMFHDLKSQRQAFQLEQFVAGLDVSRADLERAKEATFRQLLDNVWKDGVVSQSEADTLQWIERCLELPQEKADAIRQQYGLDRFRVALARAMDDGVLSDQEYEQLQQIAANIGSTAPALARRFFLAEGEGFLQAMFVAAIEDGRLTKPIWETLVATSKRFGIGDDELLKLIHTPAQRFVEHVLADAKADGRLTEQERSQLEWLLTTLQLGPAFCDYVGHEMHEVALRDDISQGRLPSVAPPAGVALRAGEIVHGWADADLVVVRLLKSGPKRDIHRGILTLSDNRAIFQSPTKAQTIGYRRIVGLRCGRSAVDIQLDGKPAWTLQLHEDLPLFPLIFRKAVALANQTETRAAERSPTRHIPRDVRQRVWQRYGGQCVDCGARDYLEFDHIIPVAKGGSNTEANVQLLCRRCNLKKSDRI